MTRREVTSVDERLRRALDVDLRDIREGVDMPPEALTARLREACDLSTLCLSLAQASSDLRRHR